MSMNVTEALNRRYSCRAFLDKPVAVEIIETLLDKAAQAPSGANTQPWQVAVVSGETKAQLQQQIEDRFNQGVRGKMDYTYYPETWIEPYDQRRKACGAQLYEALHIERTDKERRLAQWAANYRAFDAPVMLLFFLDGAMETGSYIDYGMYLQSFMLAAVEAGLATCPQAALAEYPEIVKETLGYPSDTILLCGMSLGYEDNEAPVNQYRTPREKASAFASFFD